MTVACIIQARLGSTRLPAKVLLPLPTGRTVLEEVIYRSRQIKGVDRVIVAIPDSPGNQILYYFLNEMIPDVVPYIGPEHNVLRRYRLAAESVNADVVMRITSDCPLIDPQVCEKVLAAHRECGGYVSNTLPRTWPQGYDCEVFDMALLIEADENAPFPADRDHVTPFMHRQSDRLGPNVAADGKFQGHVRLTLDTIEDYVTIWKEFERRSGELLTWSKGHYIDWPRADGTYASR